MEGWLKKQGGRVRTWKRRWFQLRGTQLLYFRDPADTSPLGVITLASPDNDFKVEVRYVLQTEEPKRKYCFEIACNESSQRTYYCCASSSKEAECWVDALNRIVYARRGGGMFGSNLSDQLRREGRKPGAVPYIVEACVKRLRRDGLDEEGIFRLPGPGPEIKALKQSFSSASLPNIDAVQIHSVGSLLKEYLRQLPEPLLTYEQYDPFCSCARDITNTLSNAVEILQPLVVQLPFDHFVLLKFLCEFLYEVEQHSKVNKMTLVNIATVFAPNFCKQEDLSAEALIRDTPLVHRITMGFIKHHTEIFSIAPEMPSPSELQGVHADSSILADASPAPLLEEFDHDDTARMSRADNLKSPTRSPPAGKLVMEAVPPDVQGPIRKVQEEVIDLSKKCSRLNRDLSQAHLDIKFMRLAYEKEKERRVDAEKKLTLLLTHLRVLGVAVPNIFETLPTDEGEDGVDSDSDDPDA